MHANRPPREIARAEAFAELNLEVSGSNEFNRFSRFEYIPHFERTRRFRI